MNQAQLGHGFNEVWRRSTVIGPCGAFASRTSALEGSRVAILIRIKTFACCVGSEFKTSSVGGRGGATGWERRCIGDCLQFFVTVLVSSAVHGEEKRGVRVFGRTDIPSHAVNGVDYESGGWFGARKTGTDKTDFAESIFGDKQLAQSLFLDRAHSPSSGTSVLINGFYERDQDQERSVTDIAEDIVASAERWFWPSISGSKPSMEVEVAVERNGKETFSKIADPSLKWEPFIRARDLAATGTTAKTPDQIAEDSIAFKVPERELPPEQAHPEFSTSLKLRVTRGDEALADHEHANSTVVFLGLQYGREIRTRKTKTHRQYAVLRRSSGRKGCWLGTGQYQGGRILPCVRARKCTTSGSSRKRWKQSYKRGARQRLANLWEFAPRKSILP